MWWVKRYIGGLMSPFRATSEARGDDTSVRHCGFERSFTLGPDQDIAVVRRLNLPAAAPSGGYDMTVVANSPAGSTFDTCSFDVR